jgi:hypothetical protein
LDAVAVDLADVEVGADFGDVGERDVVGGAPYFGVGVVLGGIRDGARMVGGGVVEGRLRESG